MRRAPLLRFDDPNYSMDTSSRQLIIPAANSRTRAGRTLEMRKKSSAFSAVSCHAGTEVAFSSRSAPIASLLQSLAVLLEGGMISTSQFSWNRDEPRTHLLPPLMKFPLRSCGIMAALSVVSHHRHVATWPSHPENIDEGSNIRGIIKESLERHFVGTFVLTLGGARR
jgi:hypothetical protein